MKLNIFSFIWYTTPPKGGVVCLNKPSLPARLTWLVWSICSSRRHEDESVNASKPYSGSTLESTPRMWLKGSGVPVKPWPPMLNASMTGGSRGCLRLAAVQEGRPLSMSSRSSDFWTGLRLGPVPWGTLLTSGIVKNSPIIFIKNGESPSVMNGSARYSMNPVQRSSVRNINCLNLPKDCVLKKPSNPDPSGAGKRATRNLDHRVRGRSNGAVDPYPLWSVGFKRSATPGSLSCTIQPESTSFWGPQPRKWQDSLPQSHYNQCVSLPALSVSTAPTLSHGKTHCYCRSGRLAQGPFVKTVSFRALTFKALFLTTLQSRYEPHGATLESSTPGGHAQPFFRRDAQTQKCPGSILPTQKESILQKMYPKMVQDMLNYKFGYI